MRPISWKILNAVAATVSVIVARVGSAGSFDDHSTPIPPFNSKYVEAYAFAGCSDREIADRFLVDEELLRARFANLLRATRGYRAYALRKAQLDAALEKNSSTLIWLGRNELGQSNNPMRIPSDLPDEP